MKKGYIIIGSNETDRTILAKQLLKDKRYLHVGGPESVDVEMITEQTSFVESDRPAFNFLLIHDLKVPAKLNQLATDLPNEFQVSNLEGQFMYTVNVKHVFSCDVDSVLIKILFRYSSWILDYQLIDTDSPSVKSIIRFLQEKR